MILILAEKPSLGRNIAAAIGQMQRRDGYLEGCGYIVSWAFGHLFSLCDLEEYRPSPDGSGRWTMDTLPCFPEEFRFELRREGRKSRRADSGVEKQFNIIRSLCNRPDVDTVVNAGDADREGEIIIRLCIRYALESDKPVKRLWLPDQTPETVSRALREMQDDKDYDNLADEGFARTYIDWLYGVNLTRYATIRTGTLLRVGRVIVPIVRAIYDRDMAIRNFVPGHYLAVQSRAETAGEVVELVSKTRFEENEADKAAALCRRYNGLGAVVTDVKRKKETIAPGKLYSLSKLQNVLGKKYKMSMQESLDIIQKLYEMGYLTYPRTNSEYLATAEKDKVKTILANVKKLGYPVEFKDGKTIFDDSKIESHSALTPTYKIPPKGSLGEKEGQVYATVFRRFVAVFCAEPCIGSKTEITVAVGDEETFSLRGMVMLEKGWTKYDDRPGKDKELPDLKKGDTVNVDFQPTAKETTPPKHYTIETLNNYLKNPFKEEKAAARDAAEAGEEPEDDAEEYRAVFEGLELGTEATRTGIIDNARQSHYIDLKKDVYTILPDGEFLIESLERMQINMDKYKTSDLGRSLKRVFHGKSTVEESVALAEEQIREVFRQAESSGDTGCFGDVVGSCPLCGRDVRRLRNFYGCTGYKEAGCKFSVNTVILGKSIPNEAVRALLQDGQTPVIEGFVSPKSGKSFSASLHLVDGKAVFDFSDAPRKQNSASAESKPAPAAKPRCPLCGKPIIRGKAAFGCAGWQAGCTLRIPFRDDVGEWSDGEVIELLAGHAVRRADGLTYKLSPDGTPGITEGGNA